MLRAVRFCLMIEGQEGVTWDEWLALARRGRAAGVRRALPLGPLLQRGTAWAGAGPRTPGPCSAALAARTDRIRLGTLVSPVTFRLPSVLAKAAVTVDRDLRRPRRDRDGRRMVGGGAHAVRVPVPPTRERFEMLEEQLEIVHGLLTEERFSFDGKPLHARGRRVPARSPCSGRTRRSSLGGKTVGPWMQRLIGRVGRRVQHRRRLARRRCANGSAARGTASPPRDASRTRS